MSSLGRVPSPPLQDDEIIGRPILWPSRWPVLAGTALVIAGTFLPWQTKIYPAGPPIVLTGASGDDKPGYQILVFVLATLLLVGLKGVAGSRTRTLQLAPAVVGSIGLLLAIQDYWTLAPKSVWDPGASSSAAIEYGFWALLLGTFLVAVGGLTTTISITRSRPLRPEIGEPPADFSFVPPLIGAVVAFVLAVVALESLQGIAAPICAIGAIAVGLAVSRGFRALTGHGGDPSAGRRTAARAPRSGPNPDQSIELQPVRPSRRD
jgi:hypothetical protein